MLVPLADAWLSLPGGILGRCPWSSLAGRCYSVCGRRRATIRGQACRPMRKLADSMPPLRASRDTAMPMRSLCAALTMLAVALLAAPAHATEDPPLVPLGAFFANPKAAWEHRISPDGTRLAWVAMHNGRATLHFRR